ncbi:pleiotropic regulatory protein DnrJ/EryC1/StrS [Acetobacter orientalis]|uniref:Pleiotropic regulatory protein DnrJ/EryC1/StrS n=1 Tax=Acetobacter orientalis TaxID=146474 RepID=A0A2Z5ZGZ0_9PROT|nr:pleiotropic regulatory protein DnrJ/EryC1/StrS [Acetobacter orientalis]
MCERKLALVTQPLDSAMGILSPTAPKQPARSLVRHDRVPSTIPVAYPRLPTTDKIIPYLNQIDQNRWYTNQGPMCNALQDRLGQFWGVGCDRVALVANATTGITLALQAHNIPFGKLCLMPSWTFTASAAAAISANLQPYFVDVDPYTWIPNPEQIEHLAKADEVGAILIVAPFGAPLDLSRWDDVAERTGRPVIIDAAAAFDTLRQDGPMRPGRSTLVVSLHATKIFGIGEGGAVITHAPAMAEHIRTLARFGFSGSRASLYPSVNAKISEYTAAVGLAGLDCWNTTRAQWLRITALYRKILSPDLMLPPDFGHNWVSATLTVIGHDNTQQTAEYLARHDIQTVSWWGEAVMFSQLMQLARALPSPLRKTTPTVPSACLSG